MESPAAEQLILRDGSAVTIRPIEASDGDRLREIWDGMSELSRRRRFLASTNAEMSEDDVRYLVEVDHNRHEALIALDEDGRAVAVARYVRTPGDRTSAELAVVVVDAWHQRGLATELLERLTDRARERGIERYTAIVSSDNEVVIDALERAGAVRTAEPDGEIEFSIDFPAEGLGDLLHDALRAAAAMPGAFLASVVRRLPVWRGPA